MKSAYRISYILLLIVLFLAAFFHPITAINVDLGRHLLLGKLIATTHHVPKTNLLSYTNPDFPYVNTSWLTDVVYYYLFVLGGFDLLLVSNTIFITFAFGLLIYYFTKKNRLTISTLFSITLYLLLLSLRSDIRPEVMSMICLSLFMVILFSYRKSRGWQIILLVPIEILWVNLHIYFFVGPLLIVLFFLDVLVTSGFKFAKTKTYFFCLAGTLVATCINPNGWYGALFPLTVLQNYGLPVAENQSILTLFATYHSSQILLPIIAIFFLFMVLFLARKNTRPIDWLLTIIFSLAAIIIFRNILLFVFTTFPIFVEQMNFLTIKYRQRIKKLPLMSYVLVYPLSLLFLFILIEASIIQNGFGFGVNAYGKNVVDFLLAHHIQGPIYNNFDIGDYLSYRIYPQRVFVDNRPEAYPTSFFQNVYLPMQDNPKIFKKLDQQYHFNAIVIEYWDNTPWGYPLLNYFANSSQFKIVYLDQYTILFMRNTPANKILIKQHQITKKNLSINAINSLQELVHYLFFFEKVGWKEQELSLLAQIRKDDQKLCILKQYPIAKTFLSGYVIKHTLAQNCAFSL